MHKHTIRLIDGAVSFRRRLGSSILSLEIENKQRRARQVVRVFRAIAGRHGTRPFSKGRGLLRADAMALPIIEGEWLNAAPVDLAAGDSHSRTSQTTQDLAGAQMTPRKVPVIGASQRARQRFDGIRN